MNTIDVIVFLVLALAVLNGWRKGLLAMLLSIAGLIAGIYLALQYGPRCGAALHLDGTTGAVAGFLIVLILTVLAAAGAGRLLRKLCSTAGLGLLDTLLGIALSVAEGVLLVGLLFKAADFLDPELIGRRTRSESVCYAPVMRVCDFVFPTVGDYLRGLLPDDEAPASEKEEVRHV